MGLEFCELSEEASLMFCRISLFGYQLQTEPRFLARCGLNPPLSVTESYVDLNGFSEKLVDTITISIMR